VKTEVANDSNAVKQATVRTEIFEAGGRAVARMESTQAVARNGTAVFDQTSRPVPNPKLWSPEQPNLYSVKTTVLEKGVPVDDSISPLGFRWIKFTADQGFFLNGEHRYLKGANVHQDHAGWGDAVADSGFLRDVKMLKEAGFDFIRGSHYPHAPAFAKACDELGVLFWSENAFWGIGGFKPDGYWNCSAYPGNPADQPEFEASVKQQLREMIRIQRNHPSVVVWSMGNETFFSDKDSMPKVKAFLADLVALSHQCDPTRPAGIGGTQRPLDAGRIDTVGDVAGYNGDGAILPVFQNPGVPSLVAEYGSTTAVRPGTYEPGWGALAKDGGKAVYPWRAGQAIWCMFDHGSIAGEALGRMGIVDYFRIPKRAWYWYRNEYRNVPPPRWPESGTPAGLKLTADQPVLKSVDGTGDTQILVTVVDASGTPVSNSPSVTLSIESGPGEFPTGPSITFDAKSDIAICDGLAAIEFRAYHSGTTVIRATSPGLRDGSLAIVSQGQPTFVNGSTPAVQPRPYVRFSGNEGGVNSNAPVSVGFQNPTSQSSETPGHGSAFANDGNAGTFWQAAGGDRAPWWQLDMEKTVQIQRVKVTFPQPGAWRYRIEASDNGQERWKPVADETGVIASVSKRTSNGALGATGRFLRVTFADGSPSAIAEIEVTGTLLAK
jgi:beta-galactosidase